jgi:CRISPR-associated protein Cas2
MENYFWNTTEVTEEKKVYILIIYDIVSNKRRVKLSKVLEGYGFRIQKSAFEALINIKLYKKILNEIPRYINEKEDSVRVYKIYGQGEVVNFGNANEIKAEDVIIL